MSRHLFIAFSNLHLLFAQALAIGRGPAETRDLWLGTQAKGSLLQELYTHMLIAGLWRHVTPLSLHRELTFPNPGRYYRHPVTFTANWFKTLKAVRALRVSENYDELWVPHPDDAFSRVLAAEMRRRGKVVHFYDEGMLIYLRHNVTLKPANFVDWAYPRFTHVLMRAAGAGAAGKSLIENLTDAWIVLPNAPSILPATLPLFDLKDHFNRSYMAEATATSSMKTVLPEALAAYPKDPFLLLLCSVEVEDHWFGLEEYQPIVLERLRAAKQMTSLVVIKPHPRSQKAVIDALVDGVRKLGMEYRLIQEQFPVPIEYLYPHLPCVGVIGGISSPLVYLRSLYQADTRSLISMMDPARLSERAAQYVETAKRLFGKDGQCVWLPKTDGSPAGRD